MDAHLEALTRATVEELAEDRRRTTTAGLVRHEVFQLAQEREPSEPLRKTWERLVADVRGEA
jgi:hypothetical protein